MTKPHKLEAGPFRVVRFCCTSGNCVDCRAEFNLKNRKRVVQMDNLSQESAAYVVEGWKAYGARFERMGDREV